MTNVTLNEYRNVCRSYTIYIVLLVTFFRISISISSVFFSLVLKKEVVLILTLALEQQLIKHVNGKYQAN